MALEDVHLARLEMYVNTHAQPTLDNDKGDEQSGTRNTATATPPAWS